MPGSVRLQSSPVMPEGLTVTEVDKEIAERHEQKDGNPQSSAHAERDRWISIAEALLLSLVALLAAWSGYSAAKWGTRSSVSLARAASTRTKASLTEIQATQIRTLDSVSFNPVLTAYAANNPRLVAIAVRRLRPGYRVAFVAWLATHPFSNPNAPPGPSYMPQYRIPQETEGRVLEAQSDRYFSTGEAAAGTADRYVRLTVFLAAVLFLVGIGSRFPVRTARYGLIAVASGLLLVSLVQLLGLPGPPS